MAAFRVARRSPSFVTMSDSANVDDTPWAVQGGHYGSPLYIPLYNRERSRENYRSGRERARALVVGVSDCDTSSSSQTSVPRSRTIWKMVFGAPSVLNRWTAEKSCNQRAENVANPKKVLILALNRFTFHFLGRILHISPCRARTSTFILQSLCVLL